MLEIETLLRAGYHELNKSKNELKSGRRVTNKARQTEPRERERQVVVYHAGQEYSQAEATFE